MNISYYRLEITLVSPLAISSGVSEQTDKDVMKDKFGIPFIPATALAGVIRSHITLRYGGAESKALFGFIKEYSEDGEQSRVRTYDATLADGEKDLYFFATRDMVALENKIGKKGAKFDMQAVEPGVKFIGYLELNDTTEERESMLEEALEAFNRGELRLGGKTTRGYGQIMVRVKKVTLDNGTDAWLDFDLFDGASWDKVDYLALSGSASDLDLTLSLKCEGGISIRSYSTNVGEPDFLTLSLKNDIPVIPGTSWAGAIRTRFAEYCSDGEFVKEIFGFAADNKKEKSQKSRIVFSESQLTGGEYLEMTRNSLDRFTSGTKDGALFTERTYYNGQTALSIRLSRLDKAEDLENACRCLAYCLMDLHNGFLSVGGLTSIGRGVFTIKGVTVNGKADQSLCDALTRSFDATKFATICMKEVYEDVEE